MNDYSDNESDIGSPGFDSQNLNTRLDTKQMVDCERNHERVLIQQRFNDIKRQIGELTTLVLILLKMYPPATEKGMAPISNGQER